MLQMERGGQTYYYYQDDLYNVVAVTDGAGAVVERYDYDDYGEPTIMDALGVERASSLIGNDYLFNGRRYDAETGLYYYRTRYLDPKAGRFLSRDTIGQYGDPVNLGNGQAFVGNNPWSRLDPFGDQAIGMDPTLAVELYASEEQKEALRERRKGDLEGFFIRGPKEFGGFPLSVVKLPFSRDVQIAFGESVDATIESSVSLMLGLRDRPASTVSQVRQGVGRAADEMVNDPTALGAAGFHALSGLVTGTALRNSLSTSNKLLNTVDEATPGHPALGQIVGIPQEQMGRKLDFLFNKNIDPSNPHNVTRAQSNAAALSRIGILDTPQNRAEITRRILQAIDDPDTIVGPGSVPGRLKRELFIPGLSKSGLKLEIIEENGRLITLMPKGVADKARQ